MKTFSLNNIAVVIMVIIIILLTIFGGCQRKRGIRLAEDLTEISTENSFYKRDNKIIKDSLDSEKKKREVLETASIELIAERDKLRQDKKILLKRLKDITIIVGEISGDSSYSYLTCFAYPFDGELKYPFNELQIKGIHRSYLENIDLTHLFSISTEELANCEQRLTNTLTLKESFKNSLVLAENQIKNDSLIISNLEDQAVILTKDAQKQQRRKKTWRTIAAVGWGGVVLLLI